MGLQKLSELLAANTDDAEFLRAKGIVHDAEENLERVRPASGLVAVVVKQVKKNISDASEKVTDTYNTFRIGWTLLSARWVRLLRYVLLVHSQR